MKDEFYIGLGDGENFGGPYGLPQLDDMIEADESIEEKIFRRVKHPGVGPTWQQVQYEHIPRFTVEFQPDIDAFIASRAQASSTILSGPNNSGKSLLLKHLFFQLGHKSCLLTCNRFSQIDVINSRVTNPNERKHLFESLTHLQESGNYHEDTNARQLDQIISALNDMKRNKLFEIAGQLLDAKVSLQKTEKDNLMSPWYVDVDGRSLKYASSGTRLLFTLLGNLLDDYFSTVLIDEPEIGLSPRIQGVLAQALYDPKTRAEYFAHLKQVFVVTHSHLFLDRNVLSNNYIVEKNGDTVTSHPVQSTAGLHELQFRMLGNDLEHLYMPAAVVVVEGPSDTTFMARLFSLHIPNRRVSIVVARGDGGAVEKVRTLSEGFGDLHTSPYQSRVFVVLDAQHDAKKSSLTRQGVLEGNIQVWAKNGIEWYFPRQHVTAAFKCNEAELVDVDFGKE
jgi:predicted ATPase